MADRLRELIHAIVNNDDPDHLMCMQQLLAQDPRVSDQRFTHGVYEGTTAMYHAT